MVSGAFEVTSALSAVYITALILRVGVELLRLGFASAEPEAGRVGKGVSGHIARITDRLPPRSRRRLLLGAGAIAVALVALEVAGLVALVA